MYKSQYKQYLFICLFISCNTFTPKLLNHKWFDHVVSYMINIQVPGDGIPILYQGIEKSGFGKTSLQPWTLSRGTEVLALGHNVGLCYDQPTIKQIVGLSSYGNINNINHLF